MILAGVLVCLAVAVGLRHPLVVSICLAVGALLIVGALMNAVGFVLLLGLIVLVVFTFVYLAL